MNARFNTVIIIAIQVQFASLKNGKETEKKRKKKLLKWREGILKNRKRKTVSVVWDYINSDDIFGRRVISKAVAANSAWNFPGHSLSEDRVKRFLEYFLFIISFKTELQKIKGEKKKRLKKKRRKKERTEKKWSST